MVQLEVQWSLGSQKVFPWTKKKIFGGKVWTSKDEKETHGLSVVIATDHSRNSGFWV